MPTETEIRKLRVLEAVVREYLEAAEPVGSATLAGKYGLNVSSATVRNDMVELTERGLLEQPHTSAGRRPTESGYRVYVREFVGDGESLADEVQRQLAAAAEDFARQQKAAARDFARRVAHITGETVFVSFGDGTAYLTGVSNLFQKPEFRAEGAACDFSAMFDRFDELVREVMSRFDHDLAICIGEENPFCPRFSSVLARWERQDGDGMLGVIGPTRMDYDLNVAVLRAVREALEQAG